VAYRFEAGRDSTVYDVAGFGGTFSSAETEGRPQWVPVSGARVGRASAVASGGERVTVGPTGGSVTADVSGDTLTVYQFGRTGGPLVDGTLPGEDFSGVGADRRLHLVWGLAPIDSATATVTFDFSRAQGVGDSTGVRLLKRDGPGATWTDVTNNWSFDAAAETFTKSGVTDVSQYAVAGDAQSLPVELAQFTGRVTEEGIRLAWRTASEEGNAGFRIQRRGGDGANADEGAWTRVGFVESKAEGGTDQPRSYRFVDADLPFAADSVRYRLKQVDVDGTARFSEPITVERGGVTTLRLKAPYPNPARDRATVPFAVPEGTDAESVQMRLYDVLGRRVRTVRASAEPGRHALRLDTGDLASGVYFLRLRAGETIRTRKVTVVR
jgi:hypothetical protein